MIEQETLTRIVEPIRMLDRLVHRDVETIEDRANSCPARAST